MEISTYHILLFTHLVSLIVGFGAVVVIDTCGLLWIFKKISISFITKVAKITQPLIWMGWSGLVLSGIPLLILKSSVSSITTIKLFAVIMLGLNGIYLHFIKKSLSKINHPEHFPKILSFRITLATFVSQICWWTAIIIGFLNNKFKANAPVIDEPFMYIKAFTITVLVVFLAGELIFRNKYK